MQGSWPGVPRAAKGHVPSRKIKAPKQNITKPDGCPTCLAVYRDKVAGAVGRSVDKSPEAGRQSLRHQQPGAPHGGGVGARPVPSRPELRPPFLGPVCIELPPSLRRTLASVAK